MKNLIDPEPDDYISQRRALLNNIAYKQAENKYRIAVERAKQKSRKEKCKERRETINMVVSLIVGIFSAIGVLFAIYRAFR